VLWLEVKRIMRSPVSIFLLFFSGLIMFMGPPSFFLERTPLGPPEVYFSLGEWGRAMFLTLETWGGIILSLFVSLLATGSFYWELSHREVLWSTPRGPGLRIVGARLAAVTAISASLLILGSVPILVSASYRGTLVAVGCKYLPLYLAIVMLRIALWVTASIFLFYLTRSRWGTVLIVVVLQAAWYITTTFQSISSTMNLVHVNFASWNFVGPFAPFGVMPPALFLQVSLVVGFAVSLLGAAFWARGRFLECLVDKNALPKVAVVLGIVLTLTSAGGVVNELHSRIAPFTVAELWSKRATLNRPYIWSKDLRLLVFPGEYTAVRLPQGSALPSWARERAKGEVLRRYDIGTMVLEGGLAPQTLVLIHPTELSLPSELKGAVSHFKNEVQPLLNRGRLWNDPRKIMFAWPMEAFFLAEIYSTQEGLIVPICFLSSVGSALWPFAWAMTASSGLDKLARCYLMLYLMAGCDKEEVEKALTWLQDQATGPTLTEMLEAHRADGEGKNVVQVICEAPKPLCRCAQLNPEAARKILNHWEQGEELGHENYIRSLLEGGHGD